ncbi:MAG: hypothetical protein OHK0029_06210 [Armatimonadaceae bacterium]
MSNPEPTAFPGETKDSTATATIPEAEPAPSTGWVSSFLNLSGTLALVAFIASLLLVWQVALLQNTVRQGQTTALEVARLHEVLTASARLHAETGEERWHQRYQDGAQQAMGILAALDTDTRQQEELRRIARELAKNLEQQITQEKKANSAVRSGSRQEAARILGSSSYRQRIEQVQGLMGRLSESARNQAQQYALSTTIGSVLAAASGLASVVLMFVASYRFRQTRILLGRSLNQQYQSLRSTRDELDTTKQQREQFARELARLEELRDVQTSQLRKTIEIDRQLRLLEQAVEAADDVVVIATADSNTSRVIRINRAFERMTGYKEVEVLGRSLKFLQGPETDRKTVAEISAKLCAQQPVQAELLNYRKDGSSFWVQLNIQPVFDDQGHLRYWISIQRDITERRRAEEEIHWQATHDILTGLPNRNLYQQALVDAIKSCDEKGHKAGVLFIDLDNFKHINDSLGHTAGDRLLQEVSRRFQSRLKDAGLVARFGGDEFTVLIPEIDSTVPAAAIAQKLLDALDGTPYQIEGHELTITASIGISIAPDDGRDIDTLLKNADSAMYRAKEQRDSFRVYHETMNARSLNRLQIETQLRRALDRQEFYLVYQPQVSLKTGEMYGVEALLRWENPQIGKVSPADFIPIAEEKGWINEIGKWALEEACRQAAAWKRMGYTLRVSVNLSARQFATQDLADQVRNALQENELPSSMLGLEITESMLLGASAEVTLARFKKLGVRLSVDDFGIGYSSFAYLRRLPLDVLKIDRLFVQGIEEDHKSDTLVRWLIELAHEMPFEVIAEGVETERQREALQQMGCDGIQGYLFSPPVAPRQIENLLREVNRKQAARAA